MLQAPSGKKRSGFTLIEVQVGVTVLMLAVAGTSVIIANDLKQLRWLEKRRPMYNFVSAGTVNSVTFTEIWIGSRQKVNKVTVDADKMNLYTSSMTALTAVVPF